MGGGDYKGGCGGGGGEAGCVDGPVILSVYGTSLMCVMLEEFVVMADKCR